MTDDAAKLEAELEADQAAYAEFEEIWCMYCFGIEGEPRRICWGCLACESCGCKCGHDEGYTEE